MTCTLFFLLAALLTQACSTTSDAFVEKSPGYAVTKGRLLRVEGLTSGAVTQLADGVVFKVDGPVCNAALEFADGTRRVLELRPNALLVLGAEHQWVLQPPPESSAGVPADGSKQ